MQKTLSFLVLIILLSPIFKVSSKNLENIIKDGIYNVKDFGAVGDGTALDSRAINKAIEAASSLGGGTVLIPAGNYLCGSIHLRSNISLYIDQGATIIAAPVSAENEYDEEEAGINTAYQDSGHSHFHNSLIWGENLQNISILGPGTIWGKGLLKDYIKGKQTANKAIALLLCKNVILRDFTILHGGWFGILATGVDNFTIDNLKMDTNRDGMDVDCCRNVRISNCSINSPYDDGICLKSSFALGVARATENVTITNCQVSGYDEGTFLDGTFKRTSNSEYKLHPTGRIKFGTESNGGFKNITISNCVFDYCRGLAIETVDGGLIEDVTITNITMRDIVNDPIFLRLGARMRGPQGAPVGEIRRVIISNIVVYNAHPWYTCTISGIPGNEIEDVQLSNIKIYYQGGSKNENSGKEIPENENKYPEPGMLGEAPAYGLFVRHAKNIKVNDVQFYSITPDARPAFVLHDVQGAEFKNVSAQTSKEADLFKFKNITKFVLKDTEGIKDNRIEKADQKSLKYGQ